MLSFDRIPFAICPLGPRSFFETLFPYSQGQANEVSISQFRKILIFLHVTSIFHGASHSHYPLQAHCLCLHAHDLAQQIYAHQWSRLVQKNQRVTAEFVPCGKFLCSSRDIESSCFPLLLHYFGENFYRWYTCVSNNRIKVITPRRLFFTAIILEIQQCTVVSADWSFSSSNILQTQLDDLPTQAAYWLS